MLPEFPFATVIFFGVVTEEVATGLVVLQFKLVLQLDDPEDMVQLEAVSVPVMAVKVAVTEVLPVTVTLQVPVPEQPPPLHPEKTEPPLAEAARVTPTP